LNIHNPDRKLANQFNDIGYTGKHLTALKKIEAYLFIYKLINKKKHFISKTRLTTKAYPFINSLPFKLTKDQLKSIDDIYRDFCSGYASKRVIVGDVGCGKTIVMLASVFICFPKKSIIMAPTTILANQIYDEAKKYLPNLRISIVTNKNKLKGDFDLIISTHALLYMDNLSNIDLIIVDEQHRFGTKQRDTLVNLTKKSNKRAHFLQFSATPIPRTLAMLQSSLVDYSFIKEIPFSKNIVTKVISKSDFLDLKNKIKDEISQNHQIIIVYPLVEKSDTIEYLSIEEAIGYWEKEFNNVYHTHGKDKKKENILTKFKSNGSILIATTLIEVGISLPKLTTIVIVGAERLGLATLHQLRGRVSRNGLSGFCYLYTNYTNIKRLKEFSQTKSGFDIAELDLKYRDSGDLIDGVTQSGKQFKWLDMSSDYEIIDKIKTTLLNHN
jgi:ATP-dependent DNA helicase RecG